ncbi:signal transduction histidine kinase [Streptomyces sp. V1I1]|nr:signal transduction histidine kinase [Streptomyces sp. V1I1]
MVVLVGSVTWLVTRRALKPVEGIRSEMAAITASEDLSRRVPEPGSRYEVARLARTTNETPAALEASVERQRRFVADASHELRSPIASLRTQLEVGASQPELSAVPGAVADTVRLQQLAGDLLLARLDAGERPGQSRLDLAALVREEASQRSGDRIPVTVTAAGGLEVTGSRGQLARVPGHLLDNAQRHARTLVTASVRRDGDSVVLAFRRRHGCAGAGTGAGLRALRTPRRRPHPGRRRCGAGSGDRPRRRPAPRWHAHGEPGPAGRRAVRTPAPRSRVSCLWAARCSGCADPLPDGPAA